MKLYENNLRLIAQLFWTPFIRQLNSSLDIRNLPGGLEWDAARSASFLERDRSFFYRAIHVGRKPGK